MAIACNACHCDPRFDLPPVCETTILHRKNTATLRRSAPVPPSLRHPDTDFCTARPMVPRLRCLPLALAAIGSSNRRLTPRLEPHTDSEIPCTAKRPSAAAQPSVFQARPGFKRYKRIERAPNAGILRCTKRTRVRRAPTGKRRRIGIITWICQWTRPRRRLSSNRTIASGGVIERFVEVSSDSAVQFQQLVDPFGTVPDTGGTGEVPYVFL